MTLPQFQISFEPLADPTAMVNVPLARFTVLSERLIRMEYSPVGVFEDRPSQVFWYRNQAVPSFQVRQSLQKLEIETSELHLVYQISEAGFTPNTLTVLVKSTGQTWHHGDWPGRGGNLWGTARTLDESVGEVPLEAGLVARAGWAVVDDSQTLVFDNHGWLVPRSQPAEGQEPAKDLYFFGYGHDYPAALHGFSQVAGAPPLIPRWILGNWWSRYWAYSQDELVSLMEEFRAHRVPLSVCIVDMDWHITQTGNRSSGWTGYTWNSALFPDPQKFIRQIHALGLKTALNLHPADGVYPHEDQYRQFAEFMGLDPEAGQPIPFDSTDPRFIQAYFEILHHPDEAQGIDFWWLDWQQGHRSRQVGLDPLWWLNHLHFHDLGRDGVKRPFIFSRWGGLGNHRYPIGFSGDTVIGWEALANQPSFTATAANVGYGWWSHDIGGHMGGIEDDELYARWVQYGLFSPILRMHSTNNPYLERRPWMRGRAAQHVAEEALRLRHALIPYLYSMAWRHHTTSLPLITPMYYSHPENPEAYQVGQQYWFGSELMAAPFTAPADRSTGLSRQTVWLPPGEWYHFFSGERLSGEGWRTIYGSLEDIPVFARPGGIVPLAIDEAWDGGEKSDQVTENIPALQLVIFPGEDNRFELVEDDGETTAYLKGAYAVTIFALTWQLGQATFTISPGRGDLRVIPPRRRYALLFRGLDRPELVKARLNDSEIMLSSIYDPIEQTLSLNSISLTPQDELVVTLTGETLLAQPRSTRQVLRKYLQAFRLNTWVKQAIDREWEVIEAGEKPLCAFAELDDAQLAVLQSLL